jgi:hypothetical protein
MMNDMMKWSCARYVVANKALNFWHNSQTQHEINRLESMAFTCLIKWVRLGLIYLVLYLCLNITRTRHNI